MLSKWLFKLCNEDGLWQELLRNKYLKGQSLSQIEKKQDTCFFCLALWVSRTISLVWEALNLLVVTKSDVGRIDSWATRFSNSNTQTCLISCAKKQTTVADVFSSNQLNVSFRRTLVGNKIVDGIIWLPV
jgi:hypothetical protein